MNEYLQAAGGATDVASTREKMLSDMTNKELADHYADMGDDPLMRQCVEAEYRLREYRMQREVADATIGAANAAKDTAHYTPQSAEYMKWSVIAIALSTFASVVVSLSGYFLKR